MVEPEKLFDRAIIVWFFWDVVLMAIPYFASPSYWKGPDTPVPFFDGFTSTGIGNGYV